MASPEDRKPLRSWKEIGAHFDVTARTAQNWERSDGLPVHRQTDGPKARVIAYTDELNAWSRTRQRHTPRKNAAGRFRWSAPAAVAAVLTIAAALWWSLVYDRPTAQQPRVRIPAQAEVTGQRVIVLDERGERCWQRPIPAVSHSAYDPRDLDPGHKLMVQDIDGDRIPEVLLVVVPRGQGETQQLIVWEADGTERWRRVFDRAITVQESSGPRTFVPSWGGWIVGSLWAGGEPHLVVHTRQKPFYVAQILILDPQTGRVEHEYLHPGGIKAIRLNDLNGDGTDEIIFGGVNNPGTGLGHAALGILQFPFESHGRGKNFFGRENAIEAGYVLFPRTDLAQVPVFVESISFPVEGKIRVDFLLGSSILYYWLTHDLQLLELTPSDSVTPTHDRLHDHELSRSEIERWRRIQHFATAPDGNSPATAGRF